MSGRDNSLGRAAIIILGLIVVILSAGLIWTTTLLSQKEASNVGIENLRNRIEYLESRIAQLEKRLHGNMTGLQEKVGSLERRINRLDEGLYNNLTYCSSKIEELESKITTLQDTIDYIASLLEKLGEQSTFTEFEKLEITTAYATYDNGEWTITLTVKNTGTSDIIIEEIFINNKPFDSYSGIGLIINHPPKLEPGDDAEITITIPTSEFSHGQSVTIAIRTTTGQEYPKTVALP